MPPVCFSQAPITKTSLTPVTRISSTPFALMAAACSMKGGRWFIEQVGVKAPGTAISTTLRPGKMSAEARGAGPSSVITVKVASGTLSPTLMLMLVVPDSSWAQPRALLAKAAGNGNRRHGADGGAFTARERVVSVGAPSLASTSVTGTSGAFGDVTAERAVSVQAPGAVFFVAKT